MKRKVQRSGSSLVVSIPAEFARRRNIREGDTLWVDEDADGLVIRPYKSAAELFAGWEQIGNMTDAEAARSVIEQREERANR